MATIRPVVPTALVSILIYVIATTVSPREVDILVPQTAPASGIPPATDAACGVIMLETSIAPTTEMTVTVGSYGEVLGGWMRLLEDTLSSEADSLASLPLAKSVRRAHVT